MSLRRWLVFGDLHFDSVSYKYRFRVFPCEHVCARQTSVPPMHLERSPPSAATLPRSFPYPVCPQCIVQSSANVTLPPWIGRRKSTASRQRRGYLTSHHGSQAVTFQDFHGAFPRKGHQGNPKSFRPKPGFAKGKVELLAMVLSSGNSEAKPYGGSQTHHPLPPKDLQCFICQTTVRFLERWHDRRSEVGRKVLSPLSQAPGIVASKILQSLRYQCSAGSFVRGFDHRSDGR
jgi:hypothetical protein